MRDKLINKMADAIAEYENENQPSYFLFKAEAALDALLGELEEMPTWNRKVTTDTVPVKFECTPRDDRARELYKQLLDLRK